MATEGQTLEQQLEELLDQEKFSPPDGFKEQAVVSDPEIYEQAEDYEAFWAERAEALTGRPSGTRCSTGRTRRSPSGSSAAS